MKNVVASGRSGGSGRVSFPQEKVSARDLPGHKTLKRRKGDAKNTVKNILTQGSLSLRSFPEDEDVGLVDEIKREGGEGSEAVEQIKVLSSDSEKEDEAALKRELELLRRQKKRQAEQKAEKKASVTIVKREARLKRDIVRDWTEETPFTSCDLRKDKSEETEVPTFMGDFHKRFLKRYIS